MRDRWKADIRYACREGAPRNVDGYRRDSATQFPGMVQEVLPMIANGLRATLGVRPPKLTASAQVSVQS